MDAWRTEKEKEEKKENLLRRRRALAELLQLEREELQVRIVVEINEIIN